MSTDRELLELAAKAAGHVIDPIDAMHDPEDWMCWNPLDSDGDALRLAVKLKICIEFYNGFAEIHASHCSGDYDSRIEYYSDDMAASSRRAIVRAAAAIGESMP